MIYRFSRFFLKMLYMAGFIAVAYLVWHGWSYYALPLAERPHAPQYQDLKPGGLWGHGLGIVGSAMILLLFLYSARKRELLGLRFGRMRSWLDIHIFFGIMGPILVTLHTSMKFNGIVVISYYSMVAVMLSGVIGRYIYIQIPRNAAGHELTLQEINATDQLITKLLVEECGVSDAILSRIQTLSGAQMAAHRSTLTAIGAIMINDMLRPIRYWRLQRLIRKENLRVSREASRRMMKLARQKAVITRRRAFLHSMQRVFHYWHVIHKPFAYVMIIIMFIHITVTIMFGYRWIF